MPRLQSALLARDLEQVRIELHERPFDRRVLGMAFDARRDLVARERLGDARQIVAGAESVERPAVGEARIFDLGFEERQLVANRPARLIEPSV